MKAMRLGPVPLIPLILAMASLAIVLTLAFGWMAVQRFQRAQDLWVSYNERAVRTNDALAQLYRRMGYRGMIHDFKNLILRRDIETYQPKLSENFRSIQALLATLQNTLNRAEEQAALLDIRDTVAQYARNNEVALDLIRSGLDSEAIDARVRVDDTRAKAALDLLSEHGEVEVRQAERRAYGEMEDALRFLQLGGVTMMLAFALAMAILLRMVRQLIATDAANREARKQLDDLLNHAPDPMLSVNVDGTVTWGNHMAEQMLGYTLGELVGQPVEQLMPERYRERHVTLRNHFFTAPRMRPMGAGVQLSVLRRDRVEVPVEISLSYHGSGPTLQAMLALRDVSERERAKAEVVAAHEREASIQSHLLESERMAALGRMVAGIAHEINTPVGVSLSAATHLDTETQSFIRQYDQGELTEEGLHDFVEMTKQACQLISINSERASQLIHSFKQVAVDQSAEEPREFELASYIDEVLLALRPALKHRPIRLDVQCPIGIQLFSLPGALAQIISNLVMNAMMHAYAPKQPGTITLQARELAGQQIELRFADDGHGMADEVQKLAFEPFYTTRRHDGGSGLGLHMVYNLVTRSLGGSISMQSRIGQGTTFLIRFPRNLDRDSTT
ncbi:ATP-binding protein [Chitinibacteraceae bacterium HSL-7]